MLSELGMEDSVGSGELIFAPQFDRLRDDRVAIMVVEKHMVIDDATGGEGEAASLVRGDFDSQFNCLDKNLAGSAWGLILAWEDNRGW